jgi:hypothetical protein
MINEYVQMLSQANALRATLEEKLANERELVRKKDERIAELEKEREELIKEFAEAECMGDLAKITRQYGYEALKEQE